MAINWDEKKKNKSIRGDAVYRDFPIRERGEKRKQVLLRLPRVTSQSRMLRPFVRCTISTWMFLNNLSFVRSHNKPIFHETTENQTKAQVAAGIDAQKNTKVANKPPLAQASQFCCFLQKAQGIHGVQSMGLEVSEEPC